MTDAVKTPLENRTVFRLSGEDVRPFLQGLVTQNMEKLSPITAIYNLLLTPQGKLLYDFFLVETQEGILVETANDFAEPLMKRLKLYKLRAKVEIEALPDWRCGVVYGDISEAEVGRVMGLGDTGAIAFVDPRLPSLGLRVLAPAGDLAKALDVINGDIGNPENYRGYRFSVGVPEGGTDIPPESLFPLDANLDVLNGIDYKKGCFVGQEVSSRMKRKGNVRKRLWSVSAEGALPDQGDLKQDGKIVGTMIAAQNKVGLALIRIDRLADDSPITIDDTVIALSRPNYLET